MYKRIALGLTALVLASTGTVFAASPSGHRELPRVAAPQPISQVPEVQSAVSALRAIEAKVASGVGYREYSAAVSELTAAISAFDEVLESKRLGSLRDSSQEILAQYQDAKTLWTACVRDSRQCLHGHINISAPAEGEAQAVAQRMLVTYPAFNRPQTDGGVLLDSMSPGNYRFVYMDSALSLLWKDAAVKGKALRAAIR